MGENKSASTVVALYRKYRPSVLEEVVGQNAVTQSLENALKSKAINHAYLFTGPRGVGKTSIARILAHAINDLPYQPNQSNHLDIIEIDGASNRKVEEIENLREKVQLGPTSAKYKVYIIDEVHMLTTHAFNALLKTLEEPPAHAVFILATTEAHKLPATIISRTQRYNFQPLNDEDLVGYMKKVANQEDIEVEDGALKLLAQQANGGMRDALSLLEQVALHHDKKVTQESIMSLFGLADKEKLELLTAAIDEGKPKMLFEELTKQYQLGTTATQLASQLAQHWRSSLRDSGSYPAWMIKGVNAMLDVLDSRYPEIKLEATLAMLLQRPSDISRQPPQTTTQLKAKSSSVVSTGPKKPKKNKEDSSADTKPEDQAPVTEMAVTEQSHRNFTLKDWPELLKRIKSNNPSLYAVLRMAKPSLEESSNELELIFGFALHKRRASDSKTMTIIKVELEKLGINSGLTISTSLKKRSNKEEDINSNPRIKAVMGALGGEMVEV